MLISLIGFADNVFYIYSREGISEKYWIISSPRYLLSCMGLLDFRCPSDMGTKLCWSYKKLNTQKLWNVHKICFWCLWPEYWCTGQLELLKEWSTANTRYTRHATDYRSVTYQKQTTSWITTLHLRQRIRTSILSRTSTRALIFGVLRTCGGLT